MITIGKSDDGKDQAPMSDLEAAAERRNMNRIVGIDPGPYESAYWTLPSR
jgi:hypothetical protein